MRGANTFYRNILLALFVCLVLPLCAQAAEGSSVVTIESAERTEYAKNPVTGNDEIVLHGNVRIRVESNSDNIVISASQISYNRKTNMLYAQGGVTLKKTGEGSGNQDSTADTLLFNTSTMEGVFDNGRVVQVQSDAINLPSDSILVVSADLFGTNSSGTVTFKNATLTFCDEPDPHWKIGASRIWLLPGGEFAFFNAVLFVGHVPVLYLPAFYYPKDELIFNPVFGYNARHGYYVQTTTYIIGRKPLAEANNSGEDGDIGEGLFNFMRATSLKEQRREGLILHNLDAEYKGRTDSYLKFMADYYTTLGGMVGLDGAFAPSSYISSLKGGLRLGFSNTVFPGSSGIYSPYNSSGKTFADGSSFLGWDLPFRYKADFSVAVSSPFTLNIKLPVYSDPYFDYDFSDRSEYMDWIGFLLSGAKDADDEDESDSSVSTFTWSADGSYSLPIPNAVRPYLDTASISSFSSSIVFANKQRGGTEDVEFLSKPSDWRTYTPERSFYYPSQVTPIKLNTRISGTIFEYPFKKKEQPKAQDFPFALTPPPSLAESKSEEPSSTTEDEPMLAEDDLPSFSVEASGGYTELDGITFALSYNITPQYISQFTYDGSTLYTPNDFDWNQVQASYYQVTVPVTLTSNVSYRDRFFSLQNSLSFVPLYQEHPSLNGYTASSENAIRRADYEARKTDISETNELTLRPLLYDPVFTDSSIVWNTSIKLFRTRFLGDAENPEWENLYADFTDKESVTVHTLSATVSSKESDLFSQRLILSTTLPPQDEEYNGTLRFTFPCLALSFKAGVKKYEEANGDEIWKKLPFQQSAELSLFSASQNVLKATESFNYNLEEDYADSLKLALSWRGLQFSYIMAYTYGSDFDAAFGWQNRTEKEFLAESASLSYVLPPTLWKTWKNRISFAPVLSTSLVCDLLRPTNSYFTFAPGVTFKIHDTLTLTFSSESRNSVVYRYVQDLDDKGIQLAGETNPFIDLYNSFAFWDEEKRQNSGFKLKNLKVSLAHSLHDWDLTAAFSISPRLVTASDGKKSYNFDPYASFSIVWRPLNGIKTQIIDEYGEWKMGSEN